MSVSYGQCSDCPGSIEAPPGVGGVSSQFNGFSSEINYYDGDNPDCYMPVSNTLNGQLEGIDNMICELNEEINSLSESCLDTSQLNNLLYLIEELENSYSTLNSVLLTSLDSTISINQTTASDTTIYDLSFNYSALEDSLLSGISASCIDSVTSISQVLNDLLYRNCDTTSIYSKGCLPDTALTPMMVANVSSLPASLTVSVTPSFLQTFPTYLCITNIIYQYEVYNSDGDIVENGNGSVYGTLSLNVPYLFQIATSYNDGARNVQITMIIQREICANGYTCPNSTYVTPSLIAVTAP